MLLDPTKIKLGPGTELNKSIVGNAHAGVQRAKSLYHFDEALGENRGPRKFANTREMISLRNDVAEAAELVEKQHREGNLGIPSSVRDGLLPALSQVKAMLISDDNRPALDKAYSYAFVHETLRQVDEAYVKIDAILNPPVIRYDDGGQANFDF